MSGYKSVVLTNASHISEEEAERLYNFVQDGGNLVVSGDKSCAFLAPVFGIGDNARMRRERFTVVFDERFVGCEQTLCLWDEPAEKPLVCGYPASEDYYTGTDALPVLYKKKIGKGSVSFIPFAIGSAYGDRKPPVIRDFLRKAVGVAPTVEIENSHLADVILSCEEGKTYVHLINNGGRHSTPLPSVFDEIVPLHNLVLKIKADKKPNKITLQPQNTELSFSYSDGHINLTLDTLELYDILVIE